MSKSKIKLQSSLLIISGLISCFYSLGALAGVTTTETQKYLVIATGEGTQGNEFVSFNMSDVEIGAVQEYVSNSSVGAPSQRVGGTDGYNGGLDLTGDWVTSDGSMAYDGVGNRFDDNDPDHPNDTVGIADSMPGARPFYEGIDYSGNAALTGELAQLNSSNSDVNATLGIQCNRAAPDCFQNPSDNNAFFAADGDSIDPNDLGYNPFNDVIKDLNDTSGPNDPNDLNTYNGISENDPAVLLAELAAQRDWIVGLDADTTFDKDFVEATFDDNRNIKDSPLGAVFTDLDAIDSTGNNDGIAVIDIDMEGATFLLNNTDWVLETMMDTLAIFRMKDGTHFNFANSSVLLGDGNDDSQDVVRDLGAIFFQDAYQGTNEVFNLSNVILGGIGLWDLTDFNPNRTTLLSQDAQGNANSIINPADGIGEERTLINLQNAQGCAQFISNQVLMSNNRWNRCAMASTASVSIPEPSSILLFSLGLFGLRRLRQ